MRQRICMQILAITGLVVSAGLANAAGPVTESRSWKDAYPVSNAPRLEVSNIWGSVQVRVGQPGHITVAVTETRSAPDQARFERSLESLKLDIRADASGVALLVGEPSDPRRRNDCRGCRVDYQFDIEVPADAVVDVATVMDGKIDIRDINGAINASNVNGPISIGGIRDCAVISNVNGPITMGFTQAPSQDCKIDSVNGDVTLDIPAVTNLDLALDLFNGRVSSELPVGPFELPPSVEQVVEDGRTRYHIQQLAGIRLGAGGPLYSIASINGDLRIGAHQ